MAIRAVIIGNENYANSTELSPSLAGTIRQAQDFQNWLINVKGAAAADIRLLTDATRQEISRAFRDLVDNGRDTTEELYVYFSGHGYSYNDSPYRQKPADVIVGTEFENRQDSGDACLKVEEIQQMLWLCLGPGTHFYFIDACRNEVSAGDVNPTGLGWSRPPSNNGKPSIFVLYSTQRGETAAVGSGFGPVLLEGLNGKGKSKRREGTKMYVTFESLCRYLESRLGQPIDENHGKGAGRILEFDPIPSYRCDVLVDNAEAADRFTLDVYNALQQQVRAPEQFSGSQHSFQEKADDYFVRVTHPTATVQPLQPAEADLYDHCTVRFKKIASAQPPPFVPPAPPPLLTVIAPPNSDILLRNTMTDEVVRTGANFTGSLPAGDYVVKARESGWRTIRRALVSLRPGQRENVDLGRRQAGPVRESIVRAVPGFHDDARVDFSESLGPMADSDLGLWLSICGASRIVRASGDFSKLQFLPLLSFDDVRPGDSPLYILMGFENLPRRVQVSVSPDGSPNWVTLNPVAGLKGVYEHRAFTAAGQQVISFRTDGSAALSVATHCLPNYATLFVAARDESRTLNLHQYILPLANLLSELPSAERERLPANPLAAIRLSALAQKQLARRRPFLPSPVIDASSDERRLWESLLHGDWLEPVIALMAAYELVQSGVSRLKPAQPGNRMFMLLRDFATRLPDAAALDRLLEGGAPPPRQVPMLSSALLAVGEYESLLPLPARRLDLGSPWTSWIGAVGGD